MGRTLLAYPDRTRNATLSSTGVWSSTLPLNNLKDPILQNVARSSSAAIANTQWTQDLGALLEVRLLSLLNHNISLVGTFRVRCYTDAGLTNLVHEVTGTAWPAGFTEGMRRTYPNNLIHVMPNALYMRYIKWEITDTTNADGYVQVGRSWAGPALQTQCGVAYGASISYDSDSSISFTDGGVPSITVKPSFRNASVTFPSLTDEERDQVLMFQKQIGKTGEFFYVENLEHTPTRMMLYSFPAMLKEMSMIDAASFNSAELPMSLRELAAGPITVEPTPGGAEGVVLLSAVEVWSQAEEDALPVGSVFVRMDLVSNPATIAGSYILFTLDGTDPRGYVLTDDGVALFDDGNLITIGEVL